MKHGYLFACLPAALLAAVALGACGSDEAASAVVVASADAGAADGAAADATTDAESPPQEAGPPVRTVETRSRFGTLDPDNLLLDGDFELSGPDAMQYPWFQLTAANVAVGMQCHSGLRCAHLDPGQFIMGVFVWPEGPVEASFYAHIQGKSCDSEAIGELTSTANYLGAPQPTVLNADSPGPDKNGYCHYSATAPLPTDTGSSFWVLIIADHKSATGPVVVDDAVVRAASGSTSNLHAVSGPPTAEAAEIVQRARDAFAKRPPVPPRWQRTPVFDRTGRLKAHNLPKP